MTTHSDNSITPFTGSTSTVAHLNHGSFQSSLLRLQATGGAGNGPAGRTPSRGPSGGPRSNRGNGKGNSRLPSNLHSYIISDVYDRSIFLSVDRNFCNEQHIKGQWTQCMTLLQVHSTHVWQTSVESVLKHLCSACLYCALKTCAHLVLISVYLVQTVYTPSVSHIPCILNATCESVNKWDSNTVTELKVILLQY